MLVDLGYISYSSTEVGLQNVFQYLLGQGLSYAQIILKYNLCKKLYKKGTPEFYQCMGVPVPQNQNKPKPVQQQQQQQQQLPPQNTAVKTPKTQWSLPFNPIIPIALGGVVILLLLLRRRNNELKEEK